MTTTLRSSGKLKIRFSLSILIILCHSTSHLTLVLLHVTSFTRGIIYYSAHSPVTRDSSDSKVTSSLFGLPSHGSPTSSSVFETDFHYFSSYFQQGSFFLLPFELFVIHALQDDVLRVRLIGRLFGEVPVGISERRVVRSNRTLVLSVSSPRVPRLFVTDICRRLMGTVRFRFI